MKNYKLNIKILAMGVFLVVVIVGTVFAHIKKNRMPAPTPVTSSPAPTLAQSDLAKVIILTYHSVEPKDPLKKETKMQARYRIDPPVFEQQMEYLKNNGYHPVTFDALVEAFTKGAPLPEKPVVLTFDDGWKNQYTYAVPILEKNNVTATFFIITGSVNGRAYMTWDELKDIQTHGFEIASHTETHPHLTKIPADKLIVEIATSKKILEEKLGITVTTFAYPYYDQNVAVQTEVKNAGYVGARAGWMKAENSLADIYALKSQEVPNTPDPFGK